MTPDFIARVSVLLLSAVSFGLSANIVASVYRDDDLIFFVSALSILFLYTFIIIFVKSIHKAHLFLWDLALLLLAFAASVDVTGYTRVWGWSCSSGTLHYYPADKTQIICSVIFGYFASAVQAYVLVCTTHFALDKVVVTPGGPKTVVTV